MNRHLLIEQILIEAGLTAAHDVVAERAGAHVLEQLLRQQRLELLRGLADRRLVTIARTGAHALELAEVGNGVGGAHGHANAPAYDAPERMRSEEHTSELQSLMRISYAGFCLKKKIKTNTNTTYQASNQ